MKLLRWINLVHNFGSPCYKHVFTAYMRQILQNSPPQNLVVSQYNFLELYIK